MTASPRPEYLRELEAWWLRTARENLGAANDTAALRALDADVAKLSDGFTTERAAGFGEYTADRKSLLAYGLFFFPQTFVRTLFQFDEIAGRCGWTPPVDRTIRVVDLGAGTGAAGLAIASRLAGRQAVELVAVEKSAASLELAAKIAQENSSLWPRLKFSATQRDLAEFADTTDSCDLIISSFAANEAFHDRPDAEFDAWIDRLLSKLNEGGLLLISEPAMATTSARLGRFRDRVAAAGRQTILAPCLHQRPCPMLARGGENFCHEVRWWRPPPSLQSLNSRLFRTIQFLKFSFVAVANARPDSGNDPAPEGAARLVSPMMGLKGKMQCEGCVADGSLRRYEILARKFPGEAKAAFLKTERGDAVRWSDCTLLGDGKTSRAEHAERTCGFE